MPNKKRPRRLSSAAQTTAPPQKISEPDRLGNELADAALRIVREQAEVACDEIRGPQIRILADTNARFWPVSSDRVKDWITQQLLERFRICVTQKQLAFVVRIVRATAWSCEKAPSQNDRSIWDAIENEPTGLALLQYLDERGGYEGRTRDLFKEVGRENFQKKLRPAFGRKNFPVNVQVFARRAASLSPLLYAVGITLSFAHKADGSYCTLKQTNTSTDQLPHFDEVSSVNASAVNQLPEIICGTDDATDGQTLTSKNPLTILDQIEALRIRNIQ
ncbi:hypothetical protein Psta_4433 [Pirellula staleyi DSM 6068]|uniref:Uncharacterized protein n=1 Tax=Pirellula staleyi (strain ATCC 27377 / DSM 6068 / ICPB 4128) TaxID=530564 RepID=D2R5Z3_PIRSD|nr:hypothetical protein [Pirellula staleyi]ADB19078.1 hypothetical protein Psta_4433 [Pirellula staleyi DSM 6068]